MPTSHVTYVGSATLLFEIALEDRVVRLLTDPVLGAAGTMNRIRGLRAFEYTSLAEPARRARELGAIDAVLLSHDQHGDNLDREGRRLLPSAGAVFTTRRGAERLVARGVPRAVGLEPWQSVELGQGAAQLIVTATPARHAPAPFHLLPAVGPVVGFLLMWSGQRHGPVWISGDTVWHRALEPLSERNVGTAFVHLGAARFRALPFAHYSMSAREAALATESLGIRRTYPVHFEGWTHFTEGKEDAAREFARRGTSGQLCWLERGVRTPLDA